MRSMKSGRGRAAGVHGAGVLTAGRRATAASALVGAALLATSLASTASAEDRYPAERWTLPYSAYPANIPACADPAVLSKIQDRFSETESSYWNSSAAIVSFETVRVLGFRPWGLDYIPRLFCTGTVVVNDGRRHRIDYSVAEDLGFIGWGWGVEYCVTGFDRERAYSPACKMARP
ncbi:hypothetical protein ABEG18_18145 [Alsobacter sp. KACC 23698]|uniref:Uncharacterized protein n=1 Tax=Alsobacter sp. KACC 23698 TaxID=3149229 RepID=A0AAU7JBH7_9HYPH